MKSFLLAAGLVIASISGLAQEVKQPTPEQLARTRAEAYAKALGLSAAQTEVLFKELLVGEEEVMDMRRQMADLNAKIDATMGKREAMAEATLGKEERAKLDALRKEGWSPCAEQCTSSKGEKAGACCAGGKQATGKAAAAPAPKPNALSK
ncbi:MAG: hypothetical protein JNL52_15535 [Flavobacteriales bacterium]|nr:hypothetical protein [Flavobacteriales bacterium]